MSSNYITSHLALMAQSDDWRTVKHEQAKLKVKSE